MYAIDMEYIDKQDEPTTVIKPKAEVAIIPPVSGG
jgi:molybdopterin converting factor small subunit